MTTDTKQVNISHKERKHGVAAQAGHFLRHLLEMVLAMSIGMAVGGALALWAARMIGIPTRSTRFLRCLLSSWHSTWLYPWLPGCVIAVWSGDR